MKRNTIYRQCGLIRDLGDDRTASIVSYIPARFAKMQQVVKLRQADGEWVNGWKVVSVGNDTNSSDLPDSHRQIKNHRAQTGDSLRR